MVSMVKNVNLNAKSVVPSVLEVEMSVLNATMTTMVLIVNVHFQSVRRTSATHVFHVKTAHGSQKI